MQVKRLLLFLFLVFLAACGGRDNKRNVPLIGFLDLLHDETLAQAKKGFFVALKENGFSPTDGSVEILYRNAQNDQPTLIQACDYLISQKVDLIATNPTLSTITAVQRTSRIPIFMMVSPSPEIAGLTDESGNAPPNLFGVFETLDYIDTSLALIKSVMPDAKKIGTVFNQSEPQSVDALEQIRKGCESLGLQIEAMPVNNSNETQLVVAALLNKKIDAFFALPDNVVFSSMEVIVQLCDKASVPVFTSEEGLVMRGALCAYGADMYSWGYQSGLQAVKMLQSRTAEGLKPEPVEFRRRVYNPEKSKLFGLEFDSTFTAVTRP
ncbi:MAG: ABC transporter substrate-binding protein [Bacteroidetes bacterium]|nr:MAG: ABC transporter substrate-binding protein [Bacteroidota bacterium]REK06509.1 MAG: ABC transporter substrate-binding protein [Bacteroidota bacterium]REK33275.1 MAG: ABC transporter substrate-binding protein [Bacteroidota bacterium]REK47112.1 MAG: ABC transporter substrate-binding protein [Bacteroidota bacterium]